jgi:ketosteroid isomerase-like protein
MKVRHLTLFVALFMMAMAVQGSSPVTENARVVERGNHAWTIGMQTGDVNMIAGIYAEDALNCGRTGECTRGHPAILASLQKSFATSGKASAATVNSRGTVREGDFIYEWGSSRLEYADGHHSEGRYLTVWQLQENGEWRISRNLSIPDDRRPSRAEREP